MAKRERPYAGETEANPDPSPGVVEQKRRDRMRAMAPTLIGSLITGAALPTQDNAKPSTRTAKRIRAAESRRVAKDKAQELQEKRDEKIAPASQRTDVLNASGEIIRAARLKRDGISFCRADPLKHLADIAEKGGMFTAQHIAAARRLVTAWDAVGDGIGLGASDWGSLRGSRGTAPTTPSGYSALLAQVEQRIEIDAAWTWLGGLWPCLEDVVLRGMSLSAWAGKADIGRNAAPGFLLASMVRLVEFYKQADKVPDRKAKIRTVEIGVVNDSNLSNNTMITVDYSEVAE